MISTGLVSPGFSWFLLVSPSPAAHYDAPLLLCASLWSLKCSVRADKAELELIPYCSTLTIKDLQPPLKTDLIGCGIMGLVSIRH